MAETFGATKKIHDRSVGSRRRQRKRHYALGFGSNYFGTLGVTVPPPSPDAFSCDSSSMEPKSDETDANGPYQWGHVSFLTLGQENFTRPIPQEMAKTSPRPTQSNPAAAASKPAVAEHKSKDSDADTARTKKEIKPKGAHRDGGSGGFKKGFLLSSSKRKKGKNKSSTISGTNDQVTADTVEAQSARVNPREPAKPNPLPKDDDDEGSDIDDFDPLPVPLTSPPTLMAVGSTHTVYCYEDPSSPNGCTIMQSGTIHGRPVTSFVPMPIRMPLRCLQLSCGKRHVLALMGDGPRMRSTRLGLFDGPITPVKRASGGHGSHGDGLTSPIRLAFESLSSGIVMSWGAGHFGQLGLGPDVTDVPQPTIIDKLLPLAVGGPIIHICAGPLHSAAIVATSAVHTRSFLFGSNRRGQCGMETCNTVPFPMPLDDVKQPEQETSVNFVRISLGRLHGVGLTETGEVFSWGSNTCGRLGHGDSCSAGAAKAGRGVRPPDRIDALKAVSLIQVAAGDAHTLALTGSGRVFAWGNNSEGQLGQAHTMNYYSPRLVGDLDFASIHSAYDEAGKLRPRKPCATDFEDETTQDRTMEAGFCSTNTNTPADAISNSHEHDMKTPPALPTYMTSSGALEAFKKTVPETPASIVPPKIVSIYASGDYSAALSSAGDLYTFGYGDGNQIGHCSRGAADKSASLLSYVEPGPKSKTGAGHRVRESCSFDSRLNVLLPHRVETTRTLGLRVGQVTLGPNNMIMLCSSRNDWGDARGMTLYEIESRRRSLGLSKLRMVSSSKKKEKAKHNAKGIPKDDNEAQTSKERDGTNANGATLSKQDNKTEGGISVEGSSGGKSRNQGISSPLRVFKKTKKRIMKR